MRYLFARILIVTWIYAWPVITNAQSKEYSSKIDSATTLLYKQKEDTNKINSLNELSTNALISSNFDIALQHAKEALKISEKIHFRKGKADALYNISSVMGQQSYTDQSLYPEIYRLTSNALEMYDELGYLLVLFGMMLLWNVAAYLSQLHPRACHREKSFLHYFLCRVI